MPKFTAYPTLVTPAGDDLLLAVDDVAGTPTTKKLTVSALMRLAWPVGSVYTSVDGTNPATLLGFGVWEAFAAGRVLIGLDAADADFDTVEETGGAKTVTLTEAQIPSHTHAVTDPGHSHIEQQNSATTGALAGFAARDTSTSTPVASGYSTQSATTGITLASTGGGAAHSNLPPYVVVYFWQRTA